MNNNPKKNKHATALKTIGKYTLTSNILGKGQFGEVVLAYGSEEEIRDDENDLNWSNQYLACKIIKKANLNPRLQMNLKSEIGILSKIQSPYIIGLFDIQKTQNNFYLFTQYCNGGDLDELRQIRGKFTEQEARYFMS